MYSKIILSLLLSFFLVSAGCGLKLGEQNKTEAKVVTLSAGSCLEESKNQFKTFFDGEAKEEQVTAAMGCIQQTLNDFKINIRGQDQNSYTADELSTLVSKQFIKDNSIETDGLISEVMKLKVVLVGGTTKVLTKDELTKIAEILGQLTPDISKLAPHMKIITMKWKVDSNRVTSEDKLKNARTSLDSLLAKVGGLLASGDRQYEVSDLIELAKEVMKTMKSSPENINKLSKAKLLVIKAKRVLIGGESFLKGNEWHPLMQTLSGAYGVLLRYKYFYDNLKEEQLAEKWTVHGQVATEVAEMIKNLLSIKQSHLFTKEELTDLILTAQDLKYLETLLDDKKISQKALDGLFDVLWKNVLIKPENRLAKKVLPGFNVEALQVLSDEVSYFIQNQIVIGELFTKKNEYTKEEILKSLKNMSQLVGVSELYKGVSAAGEMNFDENGYLKILTSTNGLYHLKDLLKANISRTVARLLIRSFAEDQNRVDLLLGAKETEIQIGFNELKKLVLELEMVDPRTVDNFIASRFREASLFVATGNGDELASFEEIDRLVLHIFSGKERAKRLEELALKKCVKGQAKVLAQTEFDRDCLIDLYLQEDAAFAGLPQFLKLKSEEDRFVIWKKPGIGLDEAVKDPEQANKSYYIGLLKAAGYEDNDRNIVLLPDAALFPHVVQYVEMIYYSFDRHQVSAQMELPEVVTAFPRFLNILRLLPKKYKQLNEKDLNGVFVWLLKNQILPGGKDLPQGAYLLAFIRGNTKCRDQNTWEWVGGEGCNETRINDWNTTTKRFGIGRIFNLLSEISKP